MAIMQVPLGLSTHTNRSYVLTSHALFNQVASPPEGPEGGGGRGTLLRPACAPKALHERTN